MRVQHGLTVVEVLIALVVLAIGVIAAAQLQASSLLFSSQAEAIKQVTRVAEAELQWRRQTALDLGDTDCQSFVPPEFSECRVEILPCVMPAGSSTFTCSSRAISPVAYQITVQVTGRHQQSFSLRSIHTGIYVAGATGELGGSWQFPSPDEDGEGAPVLP